MNLDVVREYIEMSDERKSLKAELERIETYLDNLEQTILNEFANARLADIDLKNVRLNGRTVYLRSEYKPKPRDGKKTELIDRLKSLPDLAQYVKEDYSYMSLRALVREMIESAIERLPQQDRAAFEINDALPETLRDVLEVSREFKLGITK